MPNFGALKKPILFMVILSYTILIIYNYNRNALLLIRREEQS